MNRIHNWWKRRGERLCAENKHAWKDLDHTPAETLPGTGTPFAINLAVSMFYSYARCKRCGKVGRAVK
jgi:hypothetical protein